MIVHLNLQATRIMQGGSMPRILHVSVEIAEVDTRNVSAVTEQFNSLLLKDHILDAIWDVLITAASVSEIPVPATRTEK